MGFGEAVKTCLSKYVTFSGRARRSEFWWFYLFLIIVSFVASLLDAMLGLQVMTTTTTEGTTAFVYNPGWIQTVVGLAFILPWLAVTVRRLHDKDATGWWWWLNLICCIGPLVLLFMFYVQEGTAGPNRYGPDPKGQEPVTA